MGAKLTIGVGSESKRTVVDRDLPLFEFGTIDTHGSCEADTTLRGVALGANV
jgi:hypothetical protein